MIVTNVENIFVNVLDEDSGWRCSFHPSMRDAFFNYCNEHGLPYQSLIEQSKWDEWKTPLEVQAEDTISYGNILNEELTKLTWMKNVELQNNGLVLTVTDMMNILEQTTLLKRALETGSLGTASDILTQLKIAFPPYADICDYGIEKLLIRG